MMREQTLEPDDFPVERKDNSVVTRNEPLATAPSREKAEDIARRSNVQAQGEEEDRWSASISMNDKNQSGARVTSIAMAGVILFLVAWTFVEYFAPFKSRPSAPPGTTFNSASEVGATVSPSKAPAAFPNRAETTRDSSQTAAP